MHRRRDGGVVAPTLVALLGAVVVLAVPSGIASGQAAEDEECHLTYSLPPRVVCYPRDGDEGSDTEQSHTPPPAEGNAGEPGEETETIAPSRVDDGDPEEVTPAPAPAPATTGDRSADRATEPSAEQTMDDGADHAPSIGGIGDGPTPQPPQAHGRGVLLVMLALSLGFGAVVVGVSAVRH